MKIHNGFISNSSSSSFIILQRSDTVPKELLMEKSIKTYMDYYNWDNRNENDEEYQENLSYSKEISEKYAEKNNFILFMDRVERGPAQEDVERIVVSLLNLFGIDKNKISIEWID